MRFPRDDKVDAAQTKKGAHLKQCLALPLAEPRLAVKMLAIIPESFVMSLLQLPGYPKCVQASEDLQVGKPSAGSLAARAGR